MITYSGFLHFYTLSGQLVRPVTMVPSIPGIPGPSSPQPVQSEAKLVSEKTPLFLKKNNLRN